MGCWLKIISLFKKNEKIAINRMKQFLQQNIDKKKETPTY